MASGGRPRTFVASGDGMRGSPWARPSPPGPNVPASLRLSEPLQMASGGAPGLSRALGTTSGVHPGLLGQGQAQMVPLSQLLWVSRSL